MLISRKRTLSAESHKPAPRALVMPKNKKNGRKIRDFVGVMSYTSIKMRSNPNEIIKSIRPERTPANGRTNRGKYTLVINDELTVKLPVDRLTPSEVSIDSGVVTAENAPRRLPKERSPMEVVRTAA